MRKLLGVTAIAALALPAVAGSFTLDGVRDGAYGAALVLQNSPTGFGDSNLGQQDFANGSELDAAYGIISGGSLRLFLAGNLESNFNKLEVFIDSVAGGQNRLRGDNPDVDFNGLNRMGDDGSGNGLTFDAAFAPDYYLTATGGDSGGYQLFGNFAELLTNGGGSGGFIGGSGPGNRVLLGNNGINIAIDNSNTGGVDGANVNDPSLVMTGIEIEIPLSLIGNNANSILVSVMVNGGGHDFLSNQVLGGVAGGNLGEPRSVNFDNILGDQYFKVTPEPTSLALLALGGLGLLRRR